MELLVIDNYKTVVDTEINWNLVERQAIKLLKNKSFQRKAVTAIALGMLLATQPQLAYAATHGDGIEILGRKFWGYVKRFSKWGCLIMCGMEIVKGLNGGDTKSVAKIIFKYVLAYAAVSWLPWVFDEIDTAI